MDMIETTIMLKPEERNGPPWTSRTTTGNVIAHRRRTPDELTDAMNAAVQIPGLNNAWTMPIKTRIDMLSTGIKTPVGIKIAGPDLAELERIGTEVEAVVTPGARHRQRLCRARHGRAITSSLKSTATPSPATA